MNAVSFNHVIDAQLKQCTDVLKTKAGEYATHDRLHNFKVAAALENVTPEQALAGMMAKHTVSVYDMCRDVDIDRFSMALWNEKITDSLNYLLLLRGLVEERQNGGYWARLFELREWLNDKDEVQELLNKGYTQASLAEHLGITTSAVRRLILERDKCVSEYYIISEKLGLIVEREDITNER